MIKILSADIGGTNSRFAYFTYDRDGGLTLTASMWFKTTDVDSFDDLIKRLVASDFPVKPNEVDIAVFAVAGPVEDNVYCSPPFISWDIDISDADRRYGLKSSFLINDFVAQAFACRSPIGETAQEILKGSIDYDSNVAVIGAGTALGKASLVRDSSGNYIAIPSEGGHATFPFVSESEFLFQEFMKRELGEEYITANYIVSGKGIQYIHRFLTGEKLDPEDIARCFTTGSETLEWAARFYGRVSRNYALEVLATGGVYVAGGVAAKAPILIRNEVFEKEFRSSVTMSDILSKIPVFLITNEESGLWGAALFGKQLLS
jgi:glucokinase